MDYKYVRFISVLLLVILSSGCLSSPDETEQVIEKQPIQKIVESDNPQNRVLDVPINQMMEITPDPINFNVSVTFDGYNNSNILIAVEIPEPVINSTPIITCNNTEFEPIFNDTTIYFYECECDEMSKAVLEFGEHNVTFFLLDEGNGWDFSLVNG